MKHITIILLFSLASIQMIGQEIYAIHISETQAGAYEHEIILSFGNCGEIDSVLYSLSNDTVALDLYYQVGALTVPCMDTALLLIEGIIDSCGYPLVVNSIGSNNQQVFDRQDTLVDVCVTGLRDQEKSMRLVGFPNPSRDAFTISGSGIDFSKATLRLVDVQGRSVAFSSIKETNRIVIKVDAPAGVYYLNMLYSGEVISVTLIKS